MGRSDWKVFGQIQAKDHDRLPVVLTREQIVRLIRGVRLRPYRTPIKLIYCCGLRLSECLNLTIHDVLGSELKLRILGAKGGKDRILPLSKGMLHELRRYWIFHRHPHLHFLLPGVGLDSKGRPVRCRNPKFLLPVPLLRQAYVEAWRQALATERIEVNPQVWDKTWVSSSKPSAPATTPSNTWELTFAERRLGIDACLS